MKRQGVPRGESTGTWMTLRFRSARVDDAAEVALLHADSWRRHYRGAYADSFLDGDVVADRRSVWSQRLATSGHYDTILARVDGRLVGFVHVIFDEDPRWGSFVDNLHVQDSHRRAGIGTELLARAARAVVVRAAGPGMYLWVLAQNVDAQRFYRANGATRSETAPVPPPGGDPARLKGTPAGLRMYWIDVSRLIRAPRIEESR